MITVSNLKQGYGVALDWFGGKVEFPTEELASFKADNFVRKIYFNFDGVKIKRIK